MNRLIMAFFLIACMFLLYVLYQNKNIKIKRYNFEAPFNLKIVHLSDVHNTIFGKNNIQLLEKVRLLKPNIIVITGDLLYKRKPNLGECYGLITQLLEIAPVYFVRGNHEVYLNDQGNEFIENLTNFGVKVLVNEECIVNGKIKIFGLDDINLFSPTDKEKQTEGLIKKIGLFDLNMYSILLIHQPQLFEVYKDQGFDLVLSGHTHGGIIRVPFIGGIFAPGQGFFPKYDSGLYENGKTKMIISKGLGKALIPIRVFCNPEIVEIKLTKK